MKTKPNILLIMCDQFRGDALSYQGHPNVQTPYLDTLATQGISFDKAYSACPSCIPARAALFTGRSQDKHGRIGYQDGVTWDYDHYLAEELSHAGYQTQCIGKMHVHPPRLTCGFGNIKLHDGYLGSYRSSTIPHWMNQEVSDDYLFDLKNVYGSHADFNAGGIDCNSWTSHPWIYEERMHPTNWVCDQSIRFLKTRDKTKPFFLFASYVRPHQPFDAPQTYFDLYKNQTLKEPPIGDWVDPTLNERYGRIKDSIYGCSDEQMRHDAMMGYYAAITHVDHQIGRLVNSLMEEGSYDDTIIVFLSDHGEMLFDHQLWRKVFPYEGSTHVPCIFHIGKNIKAILPKRFDEIIELRDIMPTLLAFADIEIPNTVDGISLKPLICEEEFKERPYLHGEHAFHSGLSNHFIVSKHDKFIWHSETNREQYFQLDMDPQELHDAIHDEACQTRIQELRQCLNDELKNREDGLSDGKRLISKPAKNHLDSIIKANQFDI